MAAVFATLAIVAACGARPPAARSVVLVTAVSPYLSSWIELASGGDRLMRIYAPRWVRDAVRRPALAALPVSGTDAPRLARGFYVAEVRLVARLFALGLAGSSDGFVRALGGRLDDLARGDESQVRWIVIALQVMRPGGGPGWPRDRENLARHAIGLAAGGLARREPPRIRPPPGWQCMPPAEGTDAWTPASTAGFVVAMGVSPRVVMDLVEHDVRAMLEAARLDSLHALGDAPGH